MKGRNPKSDFAILFKKHRLKSEIETLSEFGDLLAEEGYIYENSLFTRWQSGERVPRDRKLVLTIINIFVKHGGIRDEIEANTFMESADLRDLTEQEILEFSNSFLLRKQQLPEEIELFVGREQIIKDIIWQIISNKKVILYGSPGVGKTSIGIRIAHIFRNQFPFDVFWFRADLKTDEKIIDELLGFLDSKTVLIHSKDQKIKRLRKLITKKNLLMILDNFELKKNNQILSLLIDLNISLLITSIKLQNNSQFTHINLQAFTDKEFSLLAEKVLGKPFVVANYESIAEIGSLSGYLPIISNIILKQLFSKPLEIRNYISNIKKNIINLDSMTYDNKNLYKSIDICFKQLNLQLQQVLSSTVLFEGSDFDIKVIAFINDIPLEVATRLVQTLIEYSFIEASVKGRFRLHPSIKLYLKKRLQTKEILIRLSSYYSNLYKGEGQGDKVQFGQLGLDFDNIVGLIKSCEKFNLYVEITQLWHSLHIYIWVTGKWSIIFELDPLLQTSFRKSNNLKGLGYYLMDSLGRIYFFQNQIDKSFECLHQSLEIGEKIDDKYFLGLTYQKFGKIYLTTHAYQKAENYFKRALNLLKDDQNSLEYIKTHIFMGELFIKMKKFKEAYYYFKKAYQTSFKQNILDSLGICYIYLGELYLQKRHYGKAYQVFNKGLLIEKKLKREMGLAMAYDGLAKIAEKKGEKMKALRFFNIAIEHYELMGMKEKVKNVKSSKNRLLKKQ